MAPTTALFRIAARVAAAPAAVAAACTGWLGHREPPAVQRLIESVEQLGEAVAIVETSPGEATRFVHVNAAGARLFGYPAAELAGQPTARLWGALTDRDRLGWIRARMEAGAPVRLVIVLYTQTGVPLWTELGSAPIRAAGGPLHQVVTYRDVTARKQYEDALAAEKRKLHTTLAAIADAVVTAVGDGRVEFVNAAAQRLLGIELADAYGARLEDVLRLVDDGGAPIDVVAGAGLGEAARRGTGHLRTAAGALDVAYVASRVDDGEDPGVVVVLRDVTAENRISLRLSFEASHDPLTGLPNRRAFLERLEGAVDGVREHDAHHAVAFLDLDRFKVVNDRFGHATGDRLLCELARVMGRVVRGGDVIARIGGDEFGLLLADCTLENARRVVDKLRRAVDTYRIEYRGEVLGVGVSVGLVPIEVHTPSAAAALAEADAACYQAKAAGRNIVSG